MEEQIYLKALHVDVKNFESPEKKLRIQKYRDTCGNLAIFVATSLLRREVATMSSSV